MGLSRGSGSHLGGRGLASRIARLGSRSGANFLLLTLVLVGLLAGCGGGGQTKSDPPPTAPSNLAYPQTTIGATVGQAIATDTPTVSGTVTSYGVLPALPAGLSLSTSTGAISGTPTTASAQATYTVTAQNSAGSTTASVQIAVSIAAPSALVYPQTTISATIGQAITPDVPTVTGTVNSFSISPALPAGLSLNASTGVISGTPTSVSAQATYTVTAQNSVGSISATLQIAVNIAAPSSLAYPQQAISAIVGQAIAADIPLASGTIASYGISPALPAGLTLNPATGIISGTPSSASPQATYTVTAQNSSGATTATITVSVLPAQNVLLELGHATAIESLRFTSGSVLSDDVSGHWVLWNYSSGTILASGDGAQPYGAAPGQTCCGLFQRPIDMAGQTAVTSLANGLEVRAVSDGHLLSLISYPGLNVPVMNDAEEQVPPPIWWQLASDGSYICIGSKAGLFILSPTGQALASKTGDYSSANAFAAPGQVLIALGPAGANVIETVSTADGTSTVGPAFTGQFNSWFVDGNRFLTNLQTTVWVYSNASVQQAVVALPTIENLTGQGDWIWTFQSDLYPDYPITIYSIGSETPAQTYNTSVISTVVPSGSTIGILNYGAGQASVIDLSGSTPIENDYNNIPLAYLQSYAAASSSDWVIGNKNGALLDGASLSSIPRYFGYGAAWSIAGTTGTVAVSTAIGQILVFNPSGPALDETINFSSGQLALSSDGTVLGASAEANDAQYEPDRTLNFYSLPSGSVISSFPYTYQSAAGTTDLLDFTLAASGTTIGRLTTVYQSPTITREVTPIAGSPVIWSYSSNSIAGGSSISWPYSYTDPPLLSPDGTLDAESSGQPSDSTTTNIIQNGAVVTAVPGFAIGWIDNSRFLANQYQLDTTNGEYVYNNALIYNSTGQQVATLPTLPQLMSFQTVSSDSIYNATNNAIYSLTTGQSTWTGTFPSTGVGAVSGTYVVYGTGHSVVIESY